jgi:ribosome biogenesis protein SSF1/2
LFLAEPLHTPPLLSKIYQERKGNKLKDYLVLAPSLGVTHLLAFTLTPVAPYLRIIRLPAGPTLSFRIERYSLVKDLLNNARRAKSVGMEYLSPPLVRAYASPARRSRRSYWL